MIGDSKILQGVAAEEAHLARLHGARHHLPMVQARLLIPQIGKL